MTSMDVIEVEESGVDYLIKKIGASSAPIRYHVDFLNLFRTFELPAVSEVKAPEAVKSTKYSAEQIMGEKTHSAGPPAREGGGHPCSSRQTVRTARSTNVHGSQRKV